MITLGKKRKGARRKPIKRPKTRLDFFMLWCRRFGVAIGSMALVAWLGAWLVVSGAVEAAYKSGVEASLEISADAGFTVQNILVEGRENTDPHILMGLVNMRAGDPIFAFDPKAAQDLIEDITWVETVQVERRLPDTIYIELRERQPLALYNRDKKLVLIDMKGQALTDYDLDRFSHLLIVSGKGAPAHAYDLIRILKAQSAVAPYIKAAHFVENRRWTLKTNKGILVELPEEDIELALERLAMLQNEKNVFDQSFDHIDLRKNDRIVFQNSAGQVRHINASSSSSPDNNI